MGLAACVPDCAVTSICGTLLYYSQPWHMKHCYTFHATLSTTFLLPVHAQQSAWRVQRERQAHQAELYHHVWQEAEQQVAQRMRETGSGEGVLALVTGTPEEREAAKHAQEQRRLEAVRDLQEQLLAQRAQHAHHAQHGQLAGGMWGHGLPPSAQLLGRVERLRAQQARGADITAAIAASVKQVRVRLFRMMHRMLLWGKWVCWDSNLICVGKCSD